MNSFSSIVTVSNFKTAGRAIFVLALFMMSIFASSYSFAAETKKKPAPAKRPAAATATAAAPAPVPPPMSYGAQPKTREQVVFEAACGANGERADSPDCKALKEGTINDLTGKNRQCDRLSSSFTELLGKVSESCSAVGARDLKKCYRTVGDCSSRDEALADESYEDEDAPEAGSEQCDTLLANRCPHLDRYMEGRDYRQEEKYAEEKRKDAKREVDDLLEDQQKLQSEQIKMKQELQEEIQNAARSRIRKSQEILDRAKSDKENLSESTRKALDDARSVYNQMDAKYIELRDKARRATSNVRRAQDQLQATCRAAASANYTKAEAARLAAQKLGKRNVGSATGMAGGSKRKAAKDVRARNADYVAFFNECVGGVSPEGRSALNAINKAADDLKDEEQLIADQSALIEKQRLDVLQKLKEMEASVPQKEQKIIEAMNQELKNLDDDYNLAVQQANQKANSLQQEMSGKLMNIQNKLNSAQQEMQKYTQESMLAKRRDGCLGRAGKGSESKREKRNDAGNSIAGYGRQLWGLCKQIEKSNCGADNLPAGMNDTCVNYEEESKKDPRASRTKK